MSSCTQRVKLYILCQVVHTVSSCTYCVKLYKLYTMCQVVHINKLVSEELVLFHQFFFLIFPCKHLQNNYRI